jgi:effector-binding domain-containing protein
MRAVLICLSAALAALPAAAQVPQPVPVQPPPSGPTLPVPMQPPPPAPPEPTPMQPPPVVPAPTPPPATLTPSPSPVPSPVPTPPRATAPSLDADSVLAGRKGDASQVEEVTLPPKTALTLGGQATWEQGFETLQGVQRQLREAAERGGVSPAGRPVTHFIETDDLSFRYEAMLPVDRAPADASVLGAVRIGVTPAGRALRFVHNGPYDDIDGTYEGITAYLDAKGITVRDQFLEEYVNDAKDRDDASAEINIYVMPR